MIKPSTLILIITIIFSSLTPGNLIAKNHPAVKLIPQPQNIEFFDGDLVIPQTDLAIVCPKKYKELIIFIQEMSITLINKKWPILFKEDLAGLSSNTYIYFKEDENLAIGEYKYLCEDKIEISFNSKLGFRNAISTLLQIAFNSYNPKLSSYIFPQCSISDKGYFKWRGLMLDSVRHMQSLAWIKHFIDVMAFYKFTILHWHLTDDQGWRIEIDKYPKLTEIGAYREKTMIGHLSNNYNVYDDEKYGGYYTKAEIRNLIKYAKVRGIEIVPEIDLPGHMQAAIASYPKLGRPGQKISVKTKWGISDQVLELNEFSISFLKNVLTEVMELFPSKYMHIGGDEVLPNQWESSRAMKALAEKLNFNHVRELQGWLNKEMEKFIEAKGKKLIGWDEILETGWLSKNSIIMSWRGEKGAVKSANSDRYTIMTSRHHFYLDYHQDNSPDEALAIGGYSPLEKVYNYHPIPDEIDESKQIYVLGVQGNIWTEYMPTESTIEYMVFPRALAIAEIGWTEFKHKNYQRFLSNLKSHKKILKKLKINYYE